MKKTELAPIKSKTMEKESVRSKKVVKSEDSSETNKQKSQEIPFYPHQVWTFSSDFFLCMLCLCPAKATLDLKLFTQWGHLCWRVQGKMDVLDMVHNTMPSAAQKKT